MAHTYLRYECADSFGLTVSSSSSKAPPSNSMLAFLGDSRNAPLLTTAGSYCVGYNLKSSLACMRIGHREHLTGGVGTGRALNSDEMVCLDVRVDSSGAKVATGWVDGVVRVFDLESEDLKSKPGLVHSLIEENPDEDFAQREPLVLNGHNQSPVRTVVFDSSNVSRLASGGSDGAVVLWDILSESGLFRLIGHRGGITDMMFVRVDGGLDGLITASLDGLVKVWDLTGQCCTQTIANNRGEVWGAACRPLSSNSEEEKRWRLVTGGQDGRVRVWSVQPPKRNLEPESDQAPDAEVQESATNLDDVCFFMGTLIPPPNVSTSTERVACVHLHPSGRFVGVLHANSKNVDLYLARTSEETLKKRQRRLRRRQEKQKKREEVDADTSSAKTGKKRGILDEPVSSDDEGPGDTAEEPVDPELIKASDEFEYLTTIRASHKVSGFQFVPYKEKGELTRIVCSLSTNAMEIHSVQRKKST